MGDYLPIGWLSMESAPTGKARKILTANNRAHIVPQKLWVFTLSKSGEVIRSFWDETEQRWTGYRPDSPPVAWLNVPLHPLIEAQTAAVDALGEVQ